MRNFIKASLFILLLLGISNERLAAQNSGKQINIRHANSLKGDKKRGYQRLIGDVQFEHQGAVMSCDSAHFHPEANTVEAYGHVHIQQGDSLHLWGDELNYNGKDGKADVRKNVRMTDGQMTLTTDFISYDTKSKVASYTTGGKIISKSNTLTSQIGAYSSESKTLTFKKNVLLKNPQYDMKCDTLRYHPGSGVAYFIGPTTIKATNNSNIIYCENGFYDTFKDVCQFQKNAYIVTDGQTLRGDSIWYDRKNGIGKAIRNVEITDTTQKITIRGDLAVHYEKTDLSRITGNALFIQAFEDDSLFLHADTLQSAVFHRNEAIKDTSVSQKEIQAFKNVRFYKTDLQGKCDSLAWNSMDSIMQMFGRPVLWSGGNQLTAEKVLIFTANGEIHKLILEENAFIISQEDTIRFNQIKGRKMTGHFKNNELYKIYVEGNGQTLYYARDKNLLLGVNRADCSRLEIRVKENEVESITFYDKPEATLYPPLELSPKEAFLKGFKWRGQEQPLSVKDLFR
ncbi:MAG: OstA-like protein [Bacteroidia bacterium]